MVRPLEVHYRECGDRWPRNQPCICREIEDRRRGNWITAFKAVPPRFTGDERSINSEEADWFRRGWDAARNA